MYDDIWFNLITSTFPWFGIFSRLRKYKNMGNIKMNHVDFEFEVKKNF